MTRLFFSILHGCLAAALTIVIAPSLARAQPTLYSVSRDLPSLRIVNPADAATVSKVVITLPGFAVNTANGLATHPTTGELFALLSIGGDLPCGVTGRQRRLVKINPTTGVATSIGNTGDCFAGLAFHSNGKLYGLTGDGAGTPHSLFTIDTTTASPTFLLTFDADPDCLACDGEALAFNPNNGLLYRASGLVTQEFQSIDPTGLVVTKIPLSGDDIGEVTALTHSTGNVFLGADSSFSLFSITTGGVRTVPAATFEALDHRSKGLAFVTVTPPAVTKTFTVPPCRVLDTRISTPPGPILANGTRSILVAGDLTGGGTVNQGGAANCGVPDAATGVFVNVVAVNAEGPGHLTVYPFNISLPLASTLNFTTGQTIANGVLVPTCTPAGSCAFNLNITMGPAAAHVVIDVTGYLALFP